MIDVCIRNQYAYIVYSQEAEQLLSQYLLFPYKAKVRDLFQSRKGKPPKFIVVDKVEKLYDIINNGSVIRIMRPYVEFLPDELFNKIYNDSNQLVVPQMTTDEMKHILPKFELRDDQVMATTLALYNKRGILQLPTGSGKTVILSAITKVLCDNNPDKRFVIIAPSNEIVRNIIKTLSSNGVDCVWYDKNSKEVHQVTVSHIMSLVKEHSESLLRECSGVFYDECQHVSSDSYMSIITKLENCEYALGFSALVVDPTRVYSNTLTDYSYSEVKIMGSTGRVLMYSPASEYVEKGILATPVLLRVNTNFEYSESVDWHEINRKYFMSDYRCSMIADIIHSLWKLDRKVLILVKTKDQGASILNFLSRYPDILRSVGVSYGGNVGFVANYGHPEIAPFELEKRVGSEVIDEFNSGSLTILFGTTHLDEGIDINQLDACVLAGGGKNPRRIIQRVGRALRKSKSGKYAYIIDFVDNGQVVLSSHSRSRLLLYINEVGVTQDNLYLSIDNTEIENKIKFIEGI